MSDESTRFGDITMSFGFGASHAARFGLILVVANFWTTDIASAPPLETSRSARIAMSAVDLRKLTKALSAVTPMHRPLGEPRPGDWLAAFPEKGQTFLQYQRSKPLLPRGARQVLYVQPLGEFSDTQRAIVSTTAKYMKVFYGLRVKLLPARSLPDLPDDARRIHPDWKTQQIRSTYLLSDILQPALPDDAVALIALTTHDLYPNEKMNFVFGQASLQHRVGVWSMHRFGDPDTSLEDYRRCLLRTMKVATHETGHMFSMKHCIAFECNMNGSNHLEEADRRPLDVCPECMAKVCWGMNYEPLERYQQLADLCKTHELEDEQQLFEEKADAVRELYSP